MLRRLLLSLSFISLSSLSLHSVAQVDLANNGDFENGNNNWNLYSGAARVNNNAQSGSWAIRLGNNNGAEQKITGLQPNTTYRLTAWGKISGLNNARIGAKNFGGNIKLHTFTSAQYTQGEVVFTTGFGATSAVIYAYKPAGDGNAYFDNFALYQEGDSNFKLIWSDEFNGSGSYNTDTWGHERGFVRNEELQWYQQENAFLDNGNLVIEGRRERRRNPNYDPSSDNWKKKREFINYTSASLTSRKSFSWKYGRVVVRAKVTNHRGTWPAIWMLGTSCEWPSNGEVDIMENYGGRVLANFAWGTNTRWRAKWDGAGKQVSSFDSDWANRYHLWELDWEEDRMTISLDGQFMNDVKLSETINGSSRCAGQNPFQQEQYLLLNLALGSNGGSVNNLSFPTRYQVDYVRVYQRDETPSQEGVTIEAETAVLGGGAQVFDDGAASGGQGVAYLQDVGASLAINNAPAAQSVTVRYTSEVSGHISVYVNGSDAGQLNFNSTGSWSGSYADASVNVRVPSGAVFELRNDSGDSALNVDSLTFVGAGANADPTPSPVPTAIPTQVPTAMPTQVPTAVPTQVPTQAPTAAPTPTRTPVPVPTATPSHSTFVYLVHKPTGYKAKAANCNTSSGSGLVVQSADLKGWCVQWQRVEKGSFFHLKNRNSGLYLAPQADQIGASILQQPSSWTGDWTQWSFDSTDGGFGYITHKGTGKRAFTTGAMDSPITMAPTSWSGDYTQWQFTSAE